MLFGQQVRGRMVTVTHSLEERDDSTKDTGNTEKNGGVMGHGCIPGVYFVACPKPSSRATEVRE